MGHVIAQLKLAAARVPTRQVSPRRRTAGFVGLSALVIVLGLLAPAASIAATGALTGNVSDGSGKGLPSTIAVDQQNTKTVVNEGTTDASGNFTIAVAEGTYDVVVTPQSSSYVPRTVYAVNVSGSSTSLNVVLAQVGSGTISGTLVDDLGQPVPYVKISLSSPSEPTTTATSASNGAFSMNVANGYYKVEFSTSNCANGVAGDVPNISHDACLWSLETAQAALTVSGSRDFGNLALPTPTHVNVTVLNPNNEPVPEANLSVAEIGCQTCIRNYPVASGMTVAGMPITGGETWLWNNDPLLTNSKGQASILVWPSQTKGSFIVTPPTSTGLSATSLSNVPLTGDQSITVHASTGTTLSGTLVDDLGQPVPYVKITLSSPSEPTTTTTSASNGAFSMNVANGQYQVEFSTGNCANGVTGDVPNLNQDACLWSLQTAQGALTVAGSRNFGNLALPTPTHVNVTVLNPNNEPVPEANLSVAEIGCQTCIRNYPVASGMTVAGMPITGGETWLWNYHDLLTNSKGQASILVWPSQTKGSFIVTPPTSTGLAASSVNVPLTGNQAVTVHAAEGAELSGTLVDDLGQPVPYVKITLSSPSEPTTTTTSASNGAFSMNVANGQYQVEFSTGNCANGVTGDVPNLNQDACLWSLQTAQGALTVAGSRNFGNLALPTPTHVNVTVLNPNNEPVPEANLSVAEIGCQTCIRNYPVASGMTVAGMPITGGETWLWNYHDLLTNSKGQASILVWPSQTKGSFVLTPPTRTGLTAAALQNVSLAGNVQIEVLYQGSGNAPITVATRPDFYSVAFNGTLSVAAPGVIANDTVESSAMAALATPPSHGTLTFNPDGSFEYKPNAGFSGIDEFTYDVTEDGATTSPVPVRITVEPAAPPTATIHSPSGGGVYAIGQVVPTSFECADGANAPGIASCTDSHGSSGTSGTLDTSTVGPHTYSVTAISQDGQSAKAELSYTVVSGPPDFGRCLKVTIKGSGAYANSVCTKPGGTNAYQWYPAFGGAQPLLNPGFTTANKVSTGVKLETPAKRVITCTGETSGGEYSDVRTVTAITLKLTGCHLGTSEGCNSSGAAGGEIISSALVGQLGVILTSREGPTKDKIGLALKPPSGSTLAEFTCGGTAVILTGAVLAEVKANAMLLNTGVWAFNESKGIQKPLGFEGQPEQALQLKLGNAPPERVGLALKAVQTNQEKIETSSVS